MSDLRNECKSVAEARQRLVSGGLYLVQAQKVSEEEVAELRDEVLVSYSENEKLSQEKSKLQEKLTYAEARADNAERVAKEAVMAAEKAEHERDEAVTDKGKESKVVEAAKKISGFSNHVGWPK